MKRNLLTSIILPFLTVGAIEKQAHIPIPLRINAKIIAPPVSVAEIPVPAGYQRISYPESSFAAWLRKVGIKKDSRVYLYNGRLKQNQEAQYAVLDIPVGHKDLQQCADAMMRLRAQYLYSRHRFAEISFTDTNGKKYVCPGAVDSIHFERYLEQVYTWCGTLSLEKQLHPVADFNNIQPGDVLIKGGSPGHAVMVMDVAVNKAGKKVYLLAQSYMPAQDIHVLKNPMNKELSPWYEAANDNSLIVTPEWTFYRKQLRRW
jgi:hypothetical protein